MFIKKGKTNWIYILCVAFFALAVFGLNIFLQSTLAKDLVELESITSQVKIFKPTLKSVLFPSELNQNFLTQVNECFIPTSKLYGYNLRITSGFRSLDEQDAIYDLGRTEDGNIVSWAEAGKSMHNYGYAVDVVDRLRGYYINWKRLARIGEFCGLAQVDDAHFEYRGGLATEQFIKGERPAPLELPCAIMREKVIANQILAIADLQACRLPNF